MITILTSEANSLQILEQKVFSHVNATYEYLTENNLSMNLEETNFIYLNLKESYSKCLHRRKIN